MIGVIQTANKGIFIRKLTYDLEQSRIRYNVLLNDVYTDTKVKESNFNTLSSREEK